MSAPLYPPQRPLSVGETLDLTFRIYRATLAKCLPVAALAILVSQLPALYLLLTGRGLAARFATVMTEPGYRAIYFLSVVLSLSLNAAILLRQYHLSTGAQAGGELAAALRRTLTLILFVILVGLAGLVCMIPAALLLVSQSYWPVVALVCTVLVSFVLVRLSSAYALLVVTGSSAPASLRRSWSLTQGSFWRLTGIYTVAIVVLLVFYFLVGTAAGFVFALTATRADIIVITAAYAVVAVALGAFAVPFYMAVQLAVLGDLSTRREGADLAQRIAAPA